MMDELNDDFWDDLLARIGEGEVVPLVGPGAVTFGLGDENAVPMVRAPERNSIGVYVGPKATEVRPEFRDWAARVAVEHTRHPSQKTRHRTDNTVELKLRVAITPEFERWLRSWGDPVEVVKPLDLRDRVRATHQRAEVRNR
jgi:hypothetical protein